MWDSAKTRSGRQKLGRRPCFLSCWSSPVFGMGEKEDINKYPLPLPLSAPRSPLSRLPLSSLLSLPSLSSLPAGLSSPLPPSWTSRVVPTQKEDPRARCCAPAVSRSRPLIRCLGSSPHCLPPHIYLNREQGPILSYPLQNPIIVSTNHLKRPLGPSAAPQLSPAFTHTHTHTQQSRKTQQ